MEYYDRQLKDYIDSAEVQNRVLNGYDIYFINTKWHRYLSIPRRRRIIMDFKDPSITHEEFLTSKILWGYGVVKVNIPGEPKYSYRVFQTLEYARQASEEVRSQCFNP